MRLLSTNRVILAQECYLLEGVTARDDTMMCFSAEDKRLKVYDVRTGAHVVDVTGHTNAITDLVCGSSSSSSTSTDTNDGAPTNNSNILYSSQSDSGIMITDLRVGKPVHFLDEMISSGLECYSLSISHNGLQLAVGIHGDIHLIDTRTWTSQRCLESIHSDDVTRVRYCGDHWLATGGEDQLLNVMDLSVPEDDMMLDVINTGEGIQKLNWYPQHGVVTAVGTMENNWIVPLSEGAHEVKIPRADFDTYSVNFASLRGGTLLSLVRGTRNEETVGPLEAVSCMTDTWGSRVTGGPMRHGHREIARVALSVHDRLITAGEDGLVCVWDSATEDNTTNDSGISDVTAATRDDVSPASSTTSSNSSSNNERKAGHATQRIRDVQHRGGKPY